MRSASPCEPRFLTTSFRGLALRLLACLPLGATILTTVPAQAGTSTCQAINATGLLSGPPPTIPSPVCSSAVGAGDTFEIDFSSVFNPTDFSPSNTYSLQIANINTASPVSQLSFADVELLITGQLGMTMFTTPTAISIWQATGQTGQGITGYSTNGASQDFGFGPAFKSANFTLTAPQSPGTFGTAGAINTIAFNPLAAGVTSFTSAKIRGKFVGAVGIPTQPSFSAGLGIFTTNNPTTGTPNIIYGNAFNTVVPGPLPLVGAGAAFGFSRRLRRRVKAASAAC